MKKAFCLLLLLLFLPVSALADGQTGTSNYLYTIHGEAVSALSIAGSVIVIGSIVLYNVWLAGRNQTGSVEDA